ncbi:transcription initiation factor TFIID subunit 7-like [Sorex fumeus]|uniref:transcription initiation factor TFIID subunit 7-like n=1 Tax=Sorex fumeus TaxID=62283 RepID=UPI0024AD5951|nr:transcription initiation factor TFIID subunit 7-like [Sorex fumeus]
MVQTLDDPPYELENQFILRVPLEYACAVKEIAHSRNVSTKNKLRIDLTPGRNYAAVEVEDVSLTARLVNLPCIIGSLKTLDRKTFYKTADISQMLVCTGHIDTRSSSEKSTSSDDLKTIVRNERVKSKRSAWKHGIAPPLKNVRKKRFRKIRKKDLDLKEIEEMSFTEFIDCPDVENEVKRLLSSDAEAIKARWKVIGEDKTIEIESHGFIRGFGIAQEKCGHKKERILSESDILREMFNDSNSGSDEDMEIEDEEDYDDCYSYVEEEEEEYDEDEDDEDDDCEDLERDLQAKINEFKRCGAKEGSSSMVVQIQKQIHYLESKLQEIQNKEQRQNHLIMKVESLVLKTHLQSVLKQLQWEEEQKAEQFQWSCTLGYRSVAGNFLQFQEPQTTEWPDISSTTILTDSTPTAALEYQLITSHLQGRSSKPPAGPSY